jgi:hypothetical protein
MLFIIIVLELIVWTWGLTPLWVNITISALSLLFLFIKSESKTNEDYLKEIKSILLKNRD